MPSRPRSALVLSDEQRAYLVTLSKSQTEPHRLVLRARVLLLASTGLANTEIAEQVGVSRSSVIAWRERFGDEGIHKLGKVRPGRGRKPTISQERVEGIVTDTQQTTPVGETHWSCRSMARHAGVGHATVQRIWSARGLKPHLVETFKLSNDKHFEEKLIDVVGLYLHPPKKAVVLCVDEKSQIQALNRTQASLPMKRGRAGTMTHDYKRNGTTTRRRCRHVPATAPPRRVLEVPTPDRQGRATGPCRAPHCGQLRHAQARGRPGMARQASPVHLHFISTSSSWLNLVERWFRELTDKAIRRASFTSVAELIAAIEDYLAAYNKDPKPLGWTATAESILEKLKRGRVALAELTG